MNGRVPARFCRRDFIQCSKPRQFRDTISAKRANRPVQQFCCNSPYCEDRQNLVTSARSVRVAQPLIQRFGIVKMDS